MAVRFSLPLKVTLIFFLITAGGVALSTYTHYAVHKTTLFEEAQRNANDLAQIKMRELTAFFTYQKGRTVDFASDGFIRDAVQALLNEPNVLLQNQLSDHLANNKLPLNASIEAVTVLSDQGKVISTTDVDSSDISYEQATWFQEAQSLSYGSALISDFFSFDADPQTTRVAVIAPLFDREGKTRLGALMTLVSLETISNVLLEDQLTAQLLLFDAAGGVRMTTFPEEKDVAGWLWTRNVTGVCEKTDEVTELSIQDYTGAASCFSDGFPDWRLVVTIEDAVQKPSLALILQLSYLISGIVTVTIFLSFIFLRLHVLLPLQDLTQGFRHYKMGRQLHVISTKRQDEFGILAREFEQMTARLDAMHEKERQLNEQKDTFLTIASHQLQTPLGGIRWGLEFLENGLGKSLSPDALALVKSMQASCVRLVGLVADLLHVSRIELQRNHQPEVLTDVLETIHNEVKSMKSLQEMRDVTVEVKSPKKKIPSLFLKGDKLQQVIQNLLVNAIRYNKPGGRVIIDVSVLGSSIRVRVEDTGIGIPTAEQPHIFSKFYRATNAVEKEVLGSGLGLFIVKTYVESWGGKIHFESVVGKGTTFEFDIPVSKSHASKNI